MEVIRRGAAAPPAQPWHGDHAAALFANAREGMLVIDAQWRVIALNAAAVRITGYSATELLGNTPALLSGLNDRRICLAVRQGARRAGFWEGELSCRRKDGSRYLQWTSITALAGGGYGAVFTDATERKRREAALTSLAFCDSLTGLPNRALLIDRIDHALAHARRHDQYVALLFIDLDGFKAINDTHGHSRGDALLCAAAERLRQSVRADDTAARYGGDEFAVVLEAMERAEEATTVAAKIVGAFSAPLRAEGRDYRVGLSVGIACYPAHGDSAAVLIRRADEAMYRAKRAGCGGFEIA